MEFLIAFLEACEEIGILTGGSDPDGNHAYVVIDSSSNITVVVRPTGRASITVNGEELVFEIDDEVEEPAEGDTDGDEDTDIQGINGLIGRLAGALIDDNLDTKANKLMTVIEEMTDDGEPDVADDEDEEDDSEDDEEDTSDEDEDDSSNDEDEEDDESDEESDEDIEEDDADDEESDEDEEYDDEEASDKVKALENADEDEENLFEADELSAVELDLLIDNAPALIDDMIETAAGLGKLETFNVRKFNSVVGIKSKPKASYWTGAYINLAVIKDNLRVTLHTGYLSKAKTALGGTDAANLLKEYRKAVDVYLHTNRKENRRIIDVLDDLIAAVENQENRAVLLQLVYQLTTVSGPAYAGTPRNQIEKKQGLDYYLSNIRYFIGMRYSNELEGYNVFIEAHDGANRLVLLNVKADYMVSVAAGFAKVATMLGGPAHPNGTVLGKKDGRFSNTLMRMAIKLGYRSEEDTRAKLARANSVMLTEAASTELATTQAQVKKAIKALGLVVTINDGEYRVTFTKEQIPSAKSRENKANYTDDPDEAIDSAKQMREWYDKVYLKRGGKETAADAKTITPTKAIDVAYIKQQTRNNDNRLIVKLPKHCVVSCTKTGSQYNFWIDEAPRELNKGRGRCGPDDIQDVLNFAFS